MVFMPLSTKMQKCQVSFLTCFLLFFAKQTQPKNNSLLCKLQNQQECGFGKCPCDNRAKARDYHKMRDKKVFPPGKHTNPEY